MELTNTPGWVVIGISGVTCGGKTTLANRLLKALSPSYVFHQDYYFYPDDSPKHVRCDGLEHNNYDVLSALDMERMKQELEKTMRGDTSLAHEVNLEGGTHSAPNTSFLIIDGFTALNYEPVNKLCDLRYFVVLEFGECFARRALRLYEPPDVPGYFEQCVWPEHLKYRAQAESDPRIVLLDGSAPKLFERLLQDLKRFEVKPV